MAYTDRLLTFKFIAVNRDGSRVAWLSDVVREVRPDARRLSGWLSRVEAAELIARG